MSTRISFSKMVASGNDFIVLDNRSRKLNSGALKRIAKKLCDRKYGVGADGLLVMAPSLSADIRMRIFNADGSEAAMCGNGARCAALWAHEASLRKGEFAIETQAGLLRAKVSSARVRIQLTNPVKVRLRVPVKVCSRQLKVDSIDTGVPHAVIFVEGIERINVDMLGRLIRYHRCFKPAGTNVDFVQAVSNNLIKVRTYERGVESETLACGTGSVASAILYSCQLPVQPHYHIKVLTRGGEILNVYFDKKENVFMNVWLEGKVQNVFEGGCYV